MLEDLYAMPFFLRRHRTGLFGPYADDLGESLAARGHALHDVDDRLVARFAATVRCSKWTRRSGWNLYFEPPRTYVSARSRTSSRPAATPATVRDTGIVGWTPTR